MAQEEGGAGGDFEGLIRQHEGLIRKVCRLYAATRQEQEDLAQEIRLQLWRSWGSFSGLSRRSTWIYRVALNTVLTARRAQGRLPQVRAFDVGESEGWSHEGTDARIGRLYEALDQLEPGERALALLWLDNLSYGEMAEICGISPGAVGVRLHRIRERLKGLLGQFQRGKHGVF